MDKMVVVVVPDERTAYEARNALTALDQDGSIAVYAAAVVVKDQAGQVSVKEEGDQGPLGTTVGMLTGTLVGMLAGPAGAAAGALAGGYGGGIFDLVRVGIGTDFLDEVAGKLQPGKVAVIAEIDEDWVAPLDSKMEALGGEVFRRARTEVVDAQLTAEQDALDEEIADLKRETDRSTGEMKARAQKRLEAAKARLDGLRARAKASREEEQRHMDAKVRALEERARKAKGDAKAALQRGVERLKKAWERSVRSSAAHPSTD